MKILRFKMGTALSGKAMHEIYSLYPTSVWNQFIEQAEQIGTHVNNDYVLDRVETFVLQGYNYNDICCAKEGDVVFDCGAFTGNTALYFANRVGLKGKVYSFEAMPLTYKLLCENIQSDNVVKEQYAISDKRKTLHFTANAAPDSTIAINGDTIEVPAISIDEYVEERNIGKVDFIKMDIEGSELDGLNGAVKTCRRFHPKLAICIYHKDSDYIDIPKKILEINLNYKFYLEHNSNVFWETVLFAFPTDAPSVKIDIEEEYASAIQLWNILAMPLMRSKHFL